MKNTHCVERKNELDPEVKEKNSSMGKSDRIGFQKTDKKEGNDFSSCTYVSGLDPWIPIVAAIKNKRTKEMNQKNSFSLLNYVSSSLLTGGK